MREFEDWKKDSIVFILISKNIYPVDIYNLFVLIVGSQQESEHRFTNTIPGQVTSILSSHEDKVGKLREQFEEKKRTALSDLELKLLKERQDRYKAAMNAPDMPVSYFQQAFSSICFTYCNILTSITNDKEHAMLYRVSRVI